jgi:glycosyltransferase involved in cell wall biosynthesis
MTELGSGSPSPRHTVVVTTSYPSAPGDPSGHFVAAEVSGLRARGERVTVIAPRVGTPAAGPDDRFLPAGDAFGWPGVLARLRERPSRVFGLLQFVLAARRELAHHPDAARIVAHFVVPCAWPIATSRGRATVEVVAHGSDVRLVARLPRPLRRLVARGLAGAEVRCASEELRRELAMALEPHARLRFRVVPPPLDLAAAPRRAAARVALAVPEHAQLCVVVGRLLPQKRVDVALRAASLVPGALAIVVGDGPERARLERLFPEVRFVGRVPRDQALSWIAAADVLLSASALEGAPSVVREARALGTRVVARPCGDLDAWSRNDAGLHVLEGVG